MYPKIKLYFHTIKYLKFKQIQYRIYYLLRNYWQDAIRARFEEEQVITYLSKLNFEPSLPAAPTVKVNGNDFSFLNLGITFQDKINWNESKYGKLWTYNLNYFEFLQLPNFSEKEGLCLIRDYNNANIKDGLEPYPISLRSINWIKFLVKHQITDTKINQFLYRQLWKLANHIEYHVQGNHLLENGFGLLFGAYYFKEEVLYQKAVAILKAELMEQILEDGGHFELSPMYHQLLLFRALDCYNLVKHNPLFNQELLPFLKNKIEIMLGWLTQITFDNDDIPLFNDAAYNNSPTTKSLMDYGKQFGLLPHKKALGESGYRKKKTKNYEVIIDIGKIGPDYILGHAHCDIFNFVLYANKQPFIIDTGTSTYNATERRQFERSTAAHNTVQIEEEEQAEIWSSFRVARRNYPCILVDKSDFVSAELTYATSSVKHTRSFNFEPQKIQITDIITFGKVGKAYLHFHPTVEVYLINNTIKSKQGTIFIEGADNIELMAYQYAPEFNKTVPSIKAVITFSTFLKTHIFIEKESNPKTNQE